MTYQKLRDKLIKNSTIKDTAILTESKIYGHKDMIPTSVPLINLALSGRLDGGLTPGLTVIAGKSKHFKTSFMLLMASAFLNKYSEGMILFYENEFGSPESYVDSFDVNPEQIVHSPITDVEVLKVDIMKQLDGLTRDDKVIILVDSLGSLASKKEVDDAKEGKFVSDMTRAKALKSLFRIITPHLTMKDIPMVVINHVYDTQEFISKTQVSGGSGPYLAADSIWVLGRQQETEGSGKDKTVEGYRFIINIDKSRFIKEKSKFPVSVSYEGGISKWSGLFDLAVESGYIQSTTKGKYARIDKQTGEIGTEYKKDEIEENGDFWRSLLKETNFASWIENEYSLGMGKMISDHEILTLD